MRVGMGLIKNEHGVFHVRRKVPKALEVATARAMGVPKERVSWLKETLGTKDEKQAKVLAKPVMMKFDRILAQAEALLVEHPVRTELTEVEIKQIADYFYAHEVGADEAIREATLSRVVMDGTTWFAVLALPHSTRQLRRHIIPGLICRHCGGSGLMSDQGLDLSSVRPFVVKPASKSK
jgi:hypothetical protein